MHDGNQQIACKKSGKLLIRNAFTFESSKQGRGYEYDPDARSSQPLIDLAEQRCSERNILLTEPNRDSSGFQEIVKLLCCSFPIIPCVAEEHVTQVRHRRTLLDVIADWSERSHLRWRVHNRRTCT